MSVDTGAMEWPSVSVPAESAIVPNRNSSNVLDLLLQRWFAIGVLLTGLAPSIVQH
jgi:hypothetical protein